MHVRYIVGRDHNSLLNALEKPCLIHTYRTLLVFITHAASPSLLFEGTFHFHIYPIMISWVFSLVLNSEYPLNVSLLPYCQMENVSRNFLCCLAV